MMGCRRPAAWVADSGPPAELPEIQDQAHRGPESPPPRAARALRPRGGRNARRPKRIDYRQRVPPAYGQPTDRFPRRLTIPYRRTAGDVRGAPATQAPLCPRPPPEPFRARMDTVLADSTAIVPCPGP